jgi:hypothetical protein
MTQCHTKMPLLITDTPSTVFEKCSIDIISPFCPSRSQHHYILTVQDDLSNFLVSVQLEDQTGSRWRNHLWTKLCLYTGYLKLFYPIVEANF